MIEQNAKKVRAYIYDEYMDGGEMLYPDPDLCDEDGNPSFDAMAQFYSHLALLDRQGRFISVNEITPFYEITRDSKKKIKQGKDIYCGDIIIVSWKYGNRYEHSQYLIDYDTISMLFWAREIGSNAHEVFAANQISSYLTHPSRTLWEMQVIGNSYEQKMLMLDDDEEEAF